MLQSITTRSAIRRLFSVAGLGGGLALSGCATLDPGPDIERAAMIVAARSGISPVWNEPWEPSLTAWDGLAPLRVEQAVAMALRNNREIRVEIESIAAARADLVQAGLLPNPILALTLRFPFDPVSGGSFVGAQVVQSFAALWLREGKIRSADARLNQAVLDVSDKALRLVAEVRATHARIDFGQRAITLNDENLATIRRSIDSLDARVRGGEGTSLDVNRARQQLAQAEAERATIVRDTARERRRMLELIGFAASSAEWAVDKREVDESPAALDEAAAMSVAAAQRLDVAAARAIAEARRAELSVEEQGRLKEFALGADFERDVGGAKTIGPVVEVDIPIFDTNQAQIVKAGSLAHAAMANYEAAAQRATREARVAWVERDAAIRLVGQYRETVLAISVRNLALAESSLRAGQDDVTVLLDAQRSVVEARLRLNELERLAVIAEIELEYSMGGSLYAPAAHAHEDMGGTERRP
ncbi:MAG: TolC family protein [Phycisphaerales bacterium]